MTKISRNISLIKNSVMKSKKNIFRRTIFCYRGAIIIKAPKFIRWWGNLTGISRAKQLYCVGFSPFVFVSLSRDFNRRVLNHESLHARHFWECSVIGFLIGLYLCLMFQCSYWFLLLSLLVFPVWYVVEFLYYRWVKEMSYYDAYASISFEQEAYRNEENETYLATRNTCQWMQYFTKENHSLLLVQKIIAKRRWYYDYIEGKKVNDKKVLDE